MKRKRPLVIRNILEEALKGNPGMITAEFEKDSVVTIIEKNIK